MECGLGFLCPLLQLDTLCSLQHASFPPTSQPCCAPSSARSAREVISELDTLAGGCVLCHEVDFQRGGFGPRTIMLCDQVRMGSRLLGGRREEGPWPVPLMLIEQVSGLCMEGQEAGECASSGERKTGGRGPGAGGRRWEAGVLLGGCLTA